MPAAWISAGVGLYSAVKGSKGGGGRSDAAGAADPFASERPAYQQDLRTLMNGEFKPSDPSYKWRFDQGLEAVNRGAAAGGLLRSGNRLAELMNYGQGQASTEYSNQFSRLARLAGADIGSPSSAAQIMQKESGQASAYLQQLGDKAAPYIKNWWNGLNTDGGTGGGGMPTDGVDGGYTDMSGWT